MYVSAIRGTTPHPTTHLDVSLQGIAPLATVRMERVCVKRTERMVLSTVTALPATQEQLAIHVKATSATTMGTALVDCASATSGGLVLAVEPATPTTFAADMDNVIQATTQPVKTATTGTGASLAGMFALQTDWVSVGAPAHLVTE
jgi:hypothetical protein